MTQNLQGYINSKITEKFIKQTNSSDCVEMSMFAL